jgi:hypothetical protein
MKHGYEWRIGRYTTIRRFEISLRVPIVIGPGQRDLAAGMIERHRAIQEHRQSRISEPSARLDLSLVLVVVAEDDEDSERRAKNLERFELRQIRRALMQEISAEQNKIGRKTVSSEREFAHPRPSFIWPDVNIRNESDCNSSLPFSNTVTFN